MAVESFGGRKYRGLLASGANPDGSLGNFPRIEYLGVARLYGDSGGILRRVHPQGRSRPFLAIPTGGVGMEPGGVRTVRPDACLHCAQRRCVLARLVRRLPPRVHGWI